MRQRATWGKSRTKVEEARELLAGVMLAHVPVRIHHVLVNDLTSASDWFGRLSLIWFPWGSHCFFPCL